MCVVKSRAASGGQDGKEPDDPPLGREHGLALRPGRRVADEANERSGVDGDHDRHRSQNL